MGWGGPLGGGGGGRGGGAAGGAAMAEAAHLRMPGRLGQGSLKSQLRAAVHAVRPPPPPPPPLLPLCPPPGARGRGRGGWLSGPGGVDRGGS